MAAAASKTALRSGSAPSNATSASGAPVQKKANNTGLPDTLKTGVENLSGISMDDVKVHYNSPQPAQLQAHAYAQGSDIHIAPGQEKHLPHEAWHVVQQKQNRVKADTQLKGIEVNTDSALEKEADTKGAQALQMHSKTSGVNLPRVPFTSAVVQRALVKDQEILDERDGNFNWTSFRGKRDNTDPTKSAKEEGRGAQLKDVAFGGGVKSQMNWHPVDATAGEGKHMDAIIGPDHNLGSSPSEKNAVARVAAFKLLSKKSYVSGHMMNEKLGGPGNDGRNLTAISGTANSLQATNIEKYVRDPVNNQGHWYKYSIDVEYESDEKNYDAKTIQALNNLNPFPSGVHIDQHNRKVKVYYASVLQARWFQLNTTGGQHGNMIDKELQINSPLSGGNADIIDAGDLPANDQTKGVAAITDIAPEELVLTTSTLLKSVVENREGLIGLLAELRTDNTNLRETIETLKEEKEQGDEKAATLLDTIYYCGRDDGYHDGYSAYQMADDKYDYYNESYNSEVYGEGYESGYEEGYFGARQYAIGSEHGEQDANKDDDDDNWAFYDKYDRQEYKDGYNTAYDKTQGKNAGYNDGFNDWNFNPGENRSSDYTQGYQDGYNSGYNDGPYATGKRPVFKGISLCDSTGGIMSGAIHNFWGSTSVEITGEKFYQGSFAVWYQVKILSTSDWNLKNAINQNGWMKKDWLKKGG